MGHNRKDLMMTNWLNEWRDILAWTVGGLCLFLLSLLATFPYGAMQARVIAELNRATGMDVRVTDWTVGLPLGLEWKNVTLTKPDWGPIQLASLDAKVGIIAALSGGLGLDLFIRQDEGSTNQGFAKGTVTASSLSFDEPMAVKGHVQQVDLSKLLRRYVSHGTLSSDFSHRLDSVQTAAASMKGEGTWKAEAVDLVIDQIPVGNGRTLSLSFAKVSAGLLCRDITCEVTDLTGEGADGSFTGEGKITLQQPLQNSQLALTVTVVPGAGFASKAGTLGLPSLPPGTPMTLRIVGTLAQARIAL
jgi:type II secretion system protein N